MKQDIVVCRRVKCTYIKEVLKIKHLKCYSRFALKNSDVRICTFHDMITQGEAHEVIYRQGMYLMLLLMNFISIKPHIIMARKYLYSPFITLQ